MFAWVYATLILSKDQTMDCSCQDIEVYDYLTNSTLILEVCANREHCHYLFTTFTTVAIAVLFTIMCTLSCESRKKSMVYSVVDNEAGECEDQARPPNYNAI